MDKSCLRFRRKTIDKLERSLTTLRNDVLLEVGATFPRQAKEIMDVSGEQIPKDTFAAWSSRYIDDVVTVTDEVSIQFGYSKPETTVINPETGKPTSEYVYELHEDLATPHIIGNAKYLELPVNFNVKRFEEALKKSIASVIAART